VVLSLLVTALAARAEDYGLVAGTVFRGSGHALPGAEVRIQAVRPEGEVPAEKLPKPQRAVTNFRGEFTFRVPAKPMRYTLSVKAAGFTPAAKDVAIQGDERIDVSFLLEVEK
jgi:hypothetical protein